MFTSLLLALACTDYNLEKRTDRGGGTDDVDDTGGTDVDTDFSDVCEGLEATPHAVELNVECDVGLQTGRFTPTVEYHYGSSSFCGPPAVGQIVDSNGSGAIDGDDIPAILLYQGGAVVALKGDNSGVYWTTRSNSMGQDGGFAVGDLDHDGWPEVIAVGTSRVVALDGRTGGAVWSSPDVSGSLDPYGYNYPAISDMDHDGIPEVTVGNVILNGNDGSLRGTGRAGRGSAPYGGVSGASTYGTLSVPVDLDMDGVDELVTGNAAYTPNGDVKWRNAGLDGLIAVADFDNDGQGEIVKTSGIYVTGMETDGTEVWGPIMYSGNLGAPAVDDLDGDGAPDIVFAAQNALVAMNWGGTEKWRASIADYSGAAGPVLFDFELDGYPEVLYADEVSIRFFSGLDGREKFSNSEHASYTILETPIVADVDNDDQVEIILGHCNWNRALTVYGDADETWPPGRKVWNQHGYQITNVTDLGDIPTTAETNWPEYNSFRSGDVGRPPGEWIDIQAEIWDVCDRECDDDRVYVGAWATNAGNIEAPAGIPVSLRAGPGGRILDTKYTTGPIASGAVGEPMIFEVAAGALSGVEPVVVADEGPDGAGVVFECDELNNLWNWSGGVCD
jgi:hypothetical protein